MFRKFFALSFGLALLALAGMLFDSPPLWAGNCYPSSYSYSYAAPSYSYPNYSYPSYSYPVYYPVKEYYPVHHYVEREVQVPYAKPVYVQKDYYYSLKDYYQDASRDNLIAEAAAYKALLLQTNLTTASQQAVHAQGQSGYAVQQGQTLVPPGSGYAPLGGNSGGASSYQSAPQQAPQQPPQQRQQVTPQGVKKLGAGGPVNPRLQQIATASCIQCHDGTKPDRLDMRDLAALDVGERAWALALVEDGTMPKGAEPLNDEAVKLWRAHLTQAHQATKLARK